MVSGNGFFDPFFFFDRFGCRYRSMDTGIIYNNQMADFDIPGYEVVDNIYPSPFNFPEPGKRPFSSMTPTILTDDNGDVQVVIGASGGKRITTAVSLVRPRCHHQSLFVSWTTHSARAWTLAVRTIIAERINCLNETFKLSFPDDVVDRRKPGIKF